MIIVKLHGGMGNQFFQYALGRQLAERNQTELKLDTNWLTRADQDRPYQLGHFSIKAKIATGVEIRALKGIVPERAQRLLKLPLGSHVVKENSVLFDSAVLQAGPNTYLEGYWQSEKYFTSIASLIRQELSLNTKASGKNATLLEKINQTHAIALHVRRGDYVTNATANKFHGICSIDYYERAIAHISKKVENPHFYVFSDDPEWTKEHIKITYPTTYISHNGDAAHEDIRLMRACQHFIIANSTFSWWGAWLSENSEKMVIAPKQWFSGGTPNPDLLPHSWIEL